MQKAIPWIVAGVLGLAVIGVVGKMLIFPSPSEPSREVLRPGLLDRVEVGLSPAGLVGQEPDQDGNAGEDYGRAAELLDKDPAVLRQATRADEKGKELGDDAVAILKEVDAVVAGGAQKKSMQFVFVLTPKTLEVARFYEPAKPLTRLGDAMGMLARHYHLKKQYAESEAVLKHLVVMGRHMEQDHRHLDMVYRGLLIQGDAAEALSGVYESWGEGKADAQKAARDYARKVSSACTACEDKLRVLWKTRPNPGDVFYMIANDRDPAGRIQAILTLGLLRFTARERGDVRETRQLIERFAASADPMEAAAAVAARDFTQRQFHQIGVESFD